MQSKRRPYMIESDVSSMKVFCGMYLNWLFERSLQQNTSITFHIYHVSHALLSSHE